MLQSILYPVITSKTLLRVFAILTLLAGGGANADVRILLDISRSMAENNPVRVRNDALDLLLNSIPNGERAGVWTFGQYVNLLVPHETVNATWRSEARQRINSQTYPAIRTNIGRALESAAYDFNYSTFQGDVDLVLITDGKADIAPNDEVNRVERERILSQLIPMYASAGARIHTLALSDQADRSLLRQLSEQTGGHYQLISSSKDLVPAMMALSSEVAPTSQLPMDAKAFEVDGAINEMTILIYHTQGSVSLLAPNGNVTSAVQPDSQRWRVGNGFTQVSISSPQPGHWQVKGDVNSGSAIRIMSDINAQWLQPRQPIMAKGTMLELSVGLTDDDGNNLLGRLTPMLQVSARVDGQLVPVQIGADSIKARYRPDAAATESLVELTIDGGTFHRLLTRQIRYVDPYISEVLVTREGYQWRIYPNRYLNAEDIDFTATANYRTAKGEQQQPFVRTEAGYWLFTLPNDLPPGDYQLTLKGHYMAGQMTAQLPSESVQVSLPIGNRATYAMTPDVAQNAMPMPAGSDEAFVKDPMPEFEELQTDLVVNEPEQGDGWSDQSKVMAKGQKADANLLIYLLLTIPGILVLVGVYFVYRMIERRSKGLNDDEVILGGDEFASLDNVDKLAPDADLNVEALDDDLSDQPDAPLADDMIDEFALDDDSNFGDMTDELPTPNQTEAPSLAQEDMLDETRVEESAPETEIDEDLFDISSIDDDLADLDLALDGDDPFAEPDDEKRDG
jgi:hypothetical protein